MAAIADSAKNNPQNYFEHEIDGKKYRIPLIDYMPYDACMFMEDMATRRKYGDFTFVLELFSKIDPEFGEALKKSKPNRAELIGDGQDGRPKGLHLQWLEAGKISEGESSASGDS